MPDDELDLSELLDEPDTVTDEEYVHVDNIPDRVYLNGLGEGSLTPEDGHVEFIRADAIREGFTKQIWREAVRYARRTAGQPTAALKRARNLIEEGR